MSLLFAKCRSRGISAVLAAVILLGSVPALSGTYIASGPEHPQITLDVCNPLQRPSPVSKVFLAHPDSGILPEPVFEFQGTIPESSTLRLIDLTFAPDPPPPKAPL